MKILSCILMGLGIWAAAPAYADWAVKVDCAKTDARYLCGETATFTVTIGNPAKGHIPTNGLVTAELSNHGSTILSTEKFDLAVTNVFTVSGALKEPGFLMLAIRGASIRRNWGGDSYLYSVAYEPENLKPGAARPADFDAYWEGELARLEKEVPLDAKVEPIEKYSTKEATLSRVSFATFDGRRVWGILSKPSDLKKGPYPTRVEVPGAGAGYSLDSFRHPASDAIVLHLNAHYFEIPLTRDETVKASKAEGEAYAKEFGGVAEPYSLAGAASSRENQYYHHLLVGLSRAVNWLYTQEGVDTNRFTYSGTSQGGGFGLYLAGLTGKFTRLAVYVPAFADQMGFLAARRSGWPRYEGLKMTDEERARADAIWPYFDSAFFASRVTCPVRFVAGLADSVCPAAGASIAYNLCPSADKELVLVPEMPHSVFDEVYAKWNSWCHGPDGFAWPEVSAVTASGETLAFPTMPGLQKGTSYETKFETVEKKRWTRAFFTLTNTGSEPLALEKIQFFKEWRPTADANEDRGEMSGVADGSVAVYPLSRLFVAVEHPLTKNQTIDGKLTAYVPVATPLAPGESRTWSCVFGKFRPGQLRRDFQSYLEAERAHPYRVFPHYNSWFDDIGILRSYYSEKGRMSEEECLEVMRRVGGELAARGVQLDSYLWDDGWDNWDSLWDFQEKFPNGFTLLAEEAHKTPPTSIGAWMSPCGGYNEPLRRRVANAVKLGLANEGDDKLKMSNPVYYAAFRDRVLQMIHDYDMNMFKFDRFGGGTVHYEINPKFIPEVEAMFRLTQEMRAAKPDIFINATVGTWASPFWLMYVDSVWRSGWDFRLQGTGTGRQQWMTYRDNRIYDRLAGPSPLFPLNSVMSHGVIVSTNDMPSAALVADTPEATRDFADEVWTSMASGTALQELYISSAIMPSSWWDILADGIKFLRANEKVLCDTHWIGGDPVNFAGEGEVYGYASWSGELKKGILVLRNPTAETKRFVRPPSELLELTSTEAKRKIVELREVYQHEARVKPPYAADGNLDFKLGPYAVVVVELTL